MKIGEILELSMSKRMAAIAKDHLTIGEKSLRTILKAADCTHQPGKQGWIYTGSTPDILEHSIYEFVPTNKPSMSLDVLHAMKKKAKGKHASTNATTSTTMTESLSDSTMNSKGATTSTTTVTAEITALMSNKKPKVNRTYRGIYFDEDIISFLDNVPDGNKSDLVNKVMRQFLRENGLL